MKHSMRKLLALVMALTMLLGLLTACSESNAPDANGDVIVAPTTPPPEDPQEYVMYVGEKGIRSFAETLTGGYSMTTDMLSGNGEYNGASVQMRLTMSQMLIDTIETATGDSSMDLSFLKDIMLNMDVAMDGNVLMENIGIGLGNTGIATLKLLLDQSNMDIYMAIPELSEQYIKIPGSAMMDNTSAGMDMNAAMDMMGSLVEAMPTDEELANLLVKYIDLFLSEVDDVQKATETVTVGGVSQQLTVLTVNITEQDALDGVKAILAAVKNDTELEAILDRLDASLAQIAQASGESYDMDLFAQLSSGAAELLAELETVTPSADGGTLSLKVYVDGNHDMVGLDVIMPNEQEAVLNCVGVNDGSNYAFLAEVESVKITGSGTVSNRKFVLTESEKEYLVVEVRNYDAAKNQNGNMSLDLLLTPGKDLLSEMGADAAMLESLGGSFALGVVLEGNNNQARVAYDLIVGGESLIKLEAKSNMIKADVSIPQNVVDGTDQNALMNWVTSLDVNKLLENLKAAGISEDLLSGLMGELMGEMFY